MPATLVVAAYLLDRIGGAFTPGLMLPIALAAGIGTLVATVRRAAGNRTDVAAFGTIVAATFAWLIWLARPTWFPLGTGPDLTHHLLLIQYIERHWRLVHEAGVEAFLGEMVHYTPGSQILTALAGAWTGTTGLHALHPVLAATVALKTGFVWLTARRLLPPGGSAAPAATLAAMALFVVPIYFLGSFVDFSFVAQVVAELFAVAMWWALTVWDQAPRRGLMALVGLLGAAAFLTWPILVGPTLVVLGALVVLPGLLAWHSRVGHAALAVVPVALVAGLFIAGRTGMMMIAGTSGKVVWPGTDTYGWWFLAVSTTGLVWATMNLRARTTTLLTGAVLLQAGALYGVARANGNAPYMALKMFYLLLYPQAVGVALAAGAIWRAAGVRIPPRAAWAFVAALALLAARPVARATAEARGRHPATSAPLAQAGAWVRAHLPRSCVEYLVDDDETAYWLHLAVLGNPRQGARTADNATYELAPTLLRWLTPGGLPYAIADLPTLPAGVRNDLDILQSFGSAAVVSRRGPSRCDEPPPLPDPDGVARP